MASRTQLRLTQVTGSVDDTKAAAAAINETSIQGVLDHLAASIKRIHGGSVFQNQTAGAFSQTIDVTGAVTSSAGVNVGTDLDVGTSAVIGTDILIGNDAYFNSDAAIINFGADDDVSLTHVADTGLLLNGASVFQFRDSALTIGSTTDGQLDINADTELAITAPTVDIDASAEVNISNDLVVGGNLTVNGTTTTINTDSLVVEDAVIALASGSAANADVNSALVFQRATADLGGGSDQQNGALMFLQGTGFKLGYTNNNAETAQGSLAIANDDLASVWVERVNFAGDANYINTDAGGLFLYSAANFEIQSAQGVSIGLNDLNAKPISISDGGTERGTVTYDAQLGFVLSSSAGTNLALDSNSGTVIFSQEGGNPGVSVAAIELGANTANFGLSGESGITEGFIQFNNSGAQVISGSTGLRVDAGANSAALQLKSDNAQTFAFKAPGSLGGSYTVLMPGNGNIAVGKVLKVNNSLGGGEWGLDWADESVASYEKGAKVLISQVTAGTGLSFSSVDHGDAPTSLQVDYANADVFVNGQLLLSGTEANRAGGNVDYTVSGAQELKFAFNLEADDVVSVFVRG
jgi:hypothetical protein